MAASCEFTCEKCGFPVSAWDEGSPYLEYPKGKKNFIYHPVEYKAEEIALKILGRPSKEVHSHGGSGLTNEEMREVWKKYGGNISRHLCMDCGKIEEIDSEREEMRCSHCGGNHLLSVFEVSGKKCPKCGGTFSEGQMIAIS